jgi:hypothetical protein
MPNGTSISQGISRLTFFIDSTANSKQKSHKKFFLKRILFISDHFDLYDYILAKKV